MNGKRFLQIRYLLIFALIIISIRLYRPVAIFAATTETVDIILEYHQEMARPIADMINEYRTSGNAWYWNADNTTKTECGYLSALKYDYDLEKVAMQRAAEIAVVYSHTRPDGGSCFDAYTECGFYEWPGGENIAAGYRSSESIHTAWMEELDDYSGQGHRRNILKKDSVAIGIGCVYSNGTYYWVEEFSYSVQNLNETVVSTNPCTVSVRLLSDGINITGFNNDIDSNDYYWVSEDGPAQDYYGKSYWDWARDHHGYIGLESGQTTQIPLTGVLFSYSGVPTNWSARAIMDVKPAFSTGNNSVVKIENGQISALRCGSTEITAEVRGTTISIPVVVGHKYKSVIEPATKDKAGSEYQECIHCGDAKEKTEIAKIGIVRFDKDIYTYTGKAIKPDITVTDDRYRSIDRSDYTITYSNNKKVGTGLATITFKNRYSGMETIAFTINPKPVKITNIKTGKNVIVKWKKLSKQCDGYEIEYANNPSFTLNEGITVIEGSKRNSKKMLFSRRNGKRYVRIRSYRIVDGKKYYSSWSDIYSYDF